MGAQPADGYPGQEAAAVLDGRVPCRGPGQSPKPALLAVGLVVLASRAILPGDIYHITFYDELESVGPLLARCMRCRMVQEDAFEVGLRFLQDIPLKDLLR